jgi:hypothetical protein
MPELRESSVPHLGSCLMYICLRFPALRNKLKQMDLQHVSNIAKVSAVFFRLHLTSGSNFGLGHVVFSFFSLDQDGQSTDYVSSSHSMYSSRNLNPEGLAHRQEHPFNIQVNAHCALIPILLFIPALFLCATSHAESLRPIWVILLKILRFLTHRLRGCFSSCLFLCSPLR